ncbi:hypothetical protein GCM10010094_05930 [Streptomyces flaveus]|uniref:Uncharacterized protein n=1 Tax=Streptomyces flaveus TaxID=66370 RepID=A0A917V7V9_9ACTN|nr:hypothetical protein GCM10010094_05930 [Streptomyces flaveus]
MAAGGFCKLPNGSVVVALNLPTPSAMGGTGCVRVLVHAQNRARALTRVRNLGMRAVYLRSNSEPPTPDEITAVLHHPDGLIWRTPPVGDATATATTPELWRPIRALKRRTAPTQAPAPTQASVPTQAPVPAQPPAQAPEAATPRASLRAPHPPRAAPPEPAQWSPRPPRP